MGIREPHSRCGQPIKMRGRNLGILVVTAEIAVPEVVRQNDHDVRSAFSPGESGQWRQALAPEDVAFLRDRHGKVMTKYGYL